MATANLSTCSVEGCGSLRKNREYCHTHYKRFLETGSPLRPCKTCGRDFKRRGAQAYCSQECKPLCSVQGCVRKLFSRELCSTHYKHAQEGKQLGEIPEYGREGCLVGGCEAKHASRGYCATHYSRFLRSGSADRNCPTCGMQIDGRKTYCSDGCFPRCAANGCDKPATYSQFGVCKNHAGGVYRHGRLPQYSWAEEKRCIVCGKTDWPHKGRKVCSARCRQLLSRNGGEAPQWYKQCTRCTTIIDLSQRHPSGRKRRADIKVCDACHKAKYTRHRVSVTELADRDGTDCKICGEIVDMTLVFPDMFRASVDHILPYASGGTHDPENLQLSHLWCNLVKQNRPGFVM